MKAVGLLTIAALLVLGNVYADTGHHQEMTGGTELIASENVGICPVMGGPASKEFSYAYEGKTYYFCCASCIEEFKKDPAKYIAKIKELKFEAYQFGYEPSSLTVKKSDIVRLLATSRDVDHGVAIEGYNINVKVSKDKVEKIEFIADKTGEFSIICSVYCGSGHAAMKAKLIVEE